MHALDFFGQPFDKRTPVAKPGETVARCLGMQQGIDFAQFALLRFDLLALPDKLRVERAQFVLRVCESAILQNRVGIGRKQQIEHLAPTGIDAMEFARKFEVQFFARLA
jgi:hypothetical protein